MESSDGQLEYGVDSYLVPVPSGDCSIHFLVRQSIAQGKEKGKPRIEVAILVDGGKPAKEACAAIAETLETLMHEYGEYPGFHQNGPFPGFKYWLVTHWDDDHYLGALQYILENSLKPVVAASVRIDDPVLGVVDKEKHTEIKGAADGGRLLQLGKDYFSDTVYPPVSEGQSFEEWLSSLDLAPKPMFLCIAANGYSFNNTDQRQAIGNRNDTSAFFVIGWPGSNERPGTDIFVYYAAGDGNANLERYFVEKNSFNLKSSQKRALVAKGTHHGAINAFNEDLFWQMRPENYIVSAGEHYGHPTAALLVKLAFFKAYNGLKVFTTRYPYFFLLEPDNTNTTDLNTKHVIDAIKALEKRKLPTESADQEKLWRVLGKLKDLPPTDNLKKDDAKFVEARELLNILWEYLSESEKPQGANLETKPYRVDMHIRCESQGQITAKVRARGNEDPPLFF